MAAGKKKQKSVSLLFSPYGTGYFIAIRKNPKKAKLELNKYDPVVRKRGTFVEKKK